MKASLQRVMFWSRSCLRRTLAVCITGNALAISASATEAGRADWSALHLAAEAGDLSRAGELIAVDPSRVHATDTDGHTSLHVAAAAGRTEIVSLLLRQGAGEDARTKKLETPLFLASRHGHASAVRVLLEHEAGINLPDLEGRTALFVAAEGGHETVVEVLLENGAHPNATTATGESALCVAVAGGYASIVRALLEMGSLSTFHLRSGETPLSLARKRNDHAMVELLLAAGARLPGERPGAEMMLRRGLD